MSNVKFTKQELKKFVAYYTDEKNELERKLKHANEMLAKLSKDVVISTNNDIGVKLTAKGEVAKKRGPKSVWGKFITNRLRARKKPMSYDELIDDAMSLHKISEEKKANTRSSILNAAFRLRTVSGEITTVGRKGRKEKLIVRTSWLNTDGSLKEQYAKEFKKIKGGKAEKVDMSTIPAYQYGTSEV